MRASAVGVEVRRRAVHPGPWSWLAQVHGTAVHVVERPGAVRGPVGDALVTAVAGNVLAIFTADCAPVAFASEDGRGPGIVGLAHAGWRGLEAGVLASTAAAMRGLGAVRIVASLGPCIRSCCYEFGSEDLDRLAVRFGSSTRARTESGRDAFDLPAAVGSALADCDVELVVDEGSCTACGRGWFSHRARRDEERQATVVVLES
jgi:YfiH family protein